MAEVGLRLAKERNHPAAVVKLEQDYMGTIEVAKNMFIAWVRTIGVAVARRVLENAMYKNQLIFMTQHDSAFVNEVKRLLALAQTQRDSANLRVMQFWPIAKKGRDFRWRWKMLTHLERHPVERDAKYHMTDFAMMNSSMPERGLQQSLQGLAQVSLSVVAQERTISEIARAEQALSALTKRRDKDDAWLSAFAEKVRNIEELIVQKDEAVSTLAAQIQWAEDQKTEWTVDEAGAEAETELERERLGIEDY